MQAWGITLADVEAITARHGLLTSGVDMTPGRGGVARCSFTLKLDRGSRRSDGSLPYQRVTMNRYMAGRRIAAVCWHGHRDVMRDLFEHFPDARLKSALADYRGARDFEQSYRDTFGGSNGFNVGLSYGEACTCS